MSRYLKCLVATALVISGSSGTAYAAKDKHKPHHHKKNDAAAAAIIAGVIGLGIGASIAKHRNDRDDYYQWDQEQYGQPFSPAARVNCYPRQRLCYKNDHIAPKWTRRMFGDY